MTRALNTSIGTANRHPGNVMDGAHLALFPGERRGFGKAVAKRLQQKRLVHVLGPRVRLTVDGGRFADGRPRARRRPARPSAKPGKS